MRRMPVIILAVVVLAQPVLGQDDVCLPAVECALPPDCPALAEEVAEAASVCAAVETNQACVARGQVQAMRTGEAASGLASPGSTVSLDTLQALLVESAPSPPGGPGLAVLRLAGDEVGHDIRLWAIGDVQMRNTCSALQQQDARTARETELRAGPGSDYEALALLPADTEVRVNACNCTGNWFRVAAAGGDVGWLWAGSITALRDPAALPVVESGTPAYAAMRSFCFRSGTEEPACPDLPHSGVLVQVPPELGEAQLQINRVEVRLTSTAFLQSQPGEQMIVRVLDGSGRVTLDGISLHVPPGAAALVPLDADNQPAGPARLALFSPQDVATVPVRLLPRPVDLSAAVPGPAPLIAGVEPCQVRSDQAPTACRVHVVNADGDAISSLHVEFIRAPQGRWSSSVHALPGLLEGDAFSGVLAWEATCSVGSSIFIGPVQWRLAVTDAQGHRSAPFDASFNCQ